MNQLFKVYSTKQEHACCIMKKGLKSPKKRALK